MCRLQPENEATANITMNNKESLLGKIWPLPTPLVMALIPFLPQPFYLNRGYTVWFHLMSLAYFFTRSPFIRKMLILQGTGICLGWYAAIATDWFVEGAFCHTLYRNMPGSMLPYMVQEQSVDSESSYIILNTYSSWAMKSLSHILDTMGHPGLAYLFYRLHRKSGGTLSDVLTWPVIVSAWHFSRIWSLVHSYYNTGTLRFWYYGHDVYVLNNLNAYLIAYVAEGVCFGVAILCRLYLDHVDQSPSFSSLPPMKNGTKQSYDEMISIDERETAPTLIHSESAASASSML
mmetsp:Transcript_5344/g.12138  ORF Transcript_5344/g.12138 Transcript_5344/m.12138 type:complete len:290 (+) Transcript_5344:188-1057(+)|eukprot:CAMPEP_0172311680 /NCGR_PEP_ID=MMETSP1058-20130122/15506_1 /TAXON_ID=83371 /ORGANISM="Detonula confervacea, Strain CCMP 353" /LENGTH=289 /DNA_ID=CAMNT_0013024945 /DNA_START=162 /DNA_END=1034 /DNA_ORIENTATION=-